MQGSGSGVKGRGRGNLFMQNKLSSAIKQLE